MHIDCVHRVQTIDRERDELHKHKYSRNPDDPSYEAQIQALNSKFCT